MKQRRTFLLLSVVAAVLLMAIAYAAITNINLDITSNVKVTPDQADFKIAFTNTSLSGTGANESSARITGDTTGNISVNGLKSVGDKLTITYDVANSSDGIVGVIYQEHINNCITNSNPTYFNVSASLQGASYIGNSSFGDYYINNDASLVKGIYPGSSAKLVIEVKLVKTPIVDQKADINLSLQVSPYEIDKIYQ